MAKKIKVTVWNEFRHEKENPKVSALYPQGIHETIAEALRKDASLDVGTATLDEPEHGLTDEVLKATDVMIWWGHKAHKDVSDAIVAKVKTRVLEGMGLVVLHSGHYSKIFKALMGTTCSLKWRESSDKERLWNLMPSHPIMQGIGDYFEIEREEMYGEPFGIPTPDELLMVSWFTGGEVFRSAATWHRGHGRVFYFRPGHETYPTYHHADVQKIIMNAVHWTNTGVSIPDVCPNSPALEPLPKDDEAAERSTVGHR